MPKILYIDGNREQFEVLRKGLEDGYPEYQVSWAGSAVPAQMILEKGGYDCVIASYLLSDLDGLTLLQRLRQNGRNLPFILVSGQKSRVLSDKAFKLGADAFLDREEMANTAALESHIRAALQVRGEGAAGPGELEELQRQAAFFDINPAPVLQALISGQIIDHNIAAREIFGRSLKDAQLSDLFPGLSMYDIKIIANYGVSQVEQQIGENTYLFTFRSDLDSKNLYVFGSDITDRIVAESELRRAHSENEMLLASISSILVSVDRNGYIRQWNQVAESTFGISAAKIVGNKYTESGIVWRDDELVARMPALLNVKEPVHLDNVRFARPGGGDGFLTITISPIRVGSDETSGFLLLGDDVTERKILEDQLSQAQKLEAIGQLAAGIAHEINTPTQYIGDNTHFLNDSFKDLLELLATVRELIKVRAQKKPTEAAVSAIEEAAERADIDYLVKEIPTAIEQSLEGINRVTAIVKAMKEFSHPGSKEKSAVDINKALNSTITVARNEWKYVAEMATDFDPGLPTVPCYPGELNQVFLNIITNASHAIGDVVGDGSEGKGKITVTTRRDGAWAHISIGDTGKGIPENIRHRVLEPFFTTKEVGKGTGQGLAISFNVIVEKHKGTLTFDTEIGKGTTFHIRLPLEDPGKNTED